MSPKTLLRFSRHARNRMRFWHLTKDQIAAIIAKPDWVTLSRKGRQNAWKRTTKEWVRVTYIVEGAVTVVVTVTITPRGPEGRR